MRIKMFFATLALSPALFLAGYAHALKVSPTLLDLKSKPGGALQSTIVVTNELDESVTLEPVVYEAIPNSNENGNADYVEKTSNSTLANWIDVTKLGVITLAPKESKEMPVFIVIPQDAGPGTHLALMTWKTPKGEDQPGAASILNAVGVNIALDVAGQAVEKGDIVNFITEGDVKKYDKLPVTFVTKLNNSGNRHFLPKGTITVKDMFGKEVVSLPFLQTNSGGNVLPKANRTYKATWDSGFAFGKYTAVLDVMLGGAGKKTATYEFWVMPAGLAILWVIILIVVLLILGLLIKNMMLAMKKK